MANIPMLSFAPVVYSSKHGVTVTQVQGRSILYFLTEGGTVFLRIVPGTWYRRPETVIQYCIEIVHSALALLPNYAGRQQNFKLAQEGRQTSSKLVQLHGSFKHSSIQANLGLTIQNYDSCKSKPTTKSKLTTMKTSTFLSTTAIILSGVAPLAKAGNLRSRPANPEQYFKDAFKHFDRNQDNEIEAEELGFVIQALFGQQATQEAGRLVRTFGGDGEEEKLTKEQFITMMRTAFAEKADDHMTDEALQQAFTNSYDKDKSGAVDASELAELLGSHRSEAEYQELIDYVDVNGNGLCDLMDFSTVYKLHNIIVEQYRREYSSEL